MNIIQMEINTAHFRDSWKVNTFCRNLYVMDSNQRYLIIQEALNKRHE